MLELGSTSSATSKKAPASLAALPAHTQVNFGYPPWGIVTTRQLTMALDLDPGLWGTWRARRITPEPLPASWFKATTGGPRVFLVADMLAWLAHRRGEPFDRATCFVTYLNSIHMPADLSWVRRLAESAGPNQGDVRFTSAGFVAYLNSLVA